MFKTITMKMADGTTKDFDFLAVGSTQYRYKQLFKQELMKDITKLVDSDSNSLGEDADFTVSDKLAFVMNCQAEKKDLNNQNFETFLEWIEQFDSSESIKHMREFIGIYLGNKESTSEPKKEDEP